MGQTNDIVQPPKATERESEMNPDHEYRIEKGLALILWNDTFTESYCLGKGPKRDRDTLATILARFNIEVMDEGDNLTVEEVQELLPKVRNRIEKENPDIFICMASTHGQISIQTKRKKQKVMGHAILLRDGNIFTEELIQAFNDDHCRSLQGKPRFFIIETCSSTKGVNPYDEASELLISSDVIDHIRGQSVTAERKTGDLDIGKDGDDDDGVYDDDDGNDDVDDDHNDDDGDDHRGYEDENDDEIKEGKLEDRDEKPQENSKSIYVPRRQKKYFEITPSLCYKDCLIVFASPPGKFAYGSNDGGWLIRSLETAFESSIEGSEVNLVDVLTNASFTMINTKKCNYSAKDKGMKHWGITDDVKVVPFIQHRLTKDIIL